MVLIKIHTSVIPMGSHGLHWFVMCAWKQTDSNIPFKLINTHN